MIVVFPFFNSDAHLAKNLLHWMYLLGGCPQHEALLITNPEMYWPDCKPVIDLAKEVFKNTNLITLDVPVWGWPEGSNALFSKAAQYCQGTKTSWLWMEPDAIPLRTGWLEDIDSEYKKSSKPFLGCVYPCNAPHLPRRLLSGISVYPSNAYEILENVLKTEKPWDVAIADTVVPLSQHTDLIQWCYLGQNIRPTFREKREPGTNIYSLNEINPNAAIFHQNKDHTLIGLLRHKFFPQRPNAKDICIVELGRYGDIINILPVVKHISEMHHEPIAVMTAQQYADVLEGCSYVIPIPFPGRFEQINPALQMAKSRYSNLIVSQVYGENWPVDQKTDSYCKESWRQAGFLDKWGTLPLVFDQRDKVREKVLFSSLDTKQPMLLVNTNGNSSPSNGFGNELKASIRQAWSSVFNIVDLGDLRATRIYDLLGLYDRAELLITTDTATLHLAAASQVPTIEIRAQHSNPWLASPVKGNRCLLNLFYGEVSAKINQIHEAIDKARDLANTNPILTVAWSDWKPSDATTIRRMALASRTVYEAKQKYRNWKFMPITDESLPRLFVDGNRKLPYVKDIIEMAFDSKSNDHWIVLINSDICIGEDFCQMVLHNIKTNKAFSVRRNEFNTLMRPLEDHDIGRGKRSIGADAFGFSKAWWQIAKHRFPDMVIAAEGWDLAMTKLILMSGGDLYYDLIYHEYHFPFWYRPENRTRLPSQLHNIRLAKEFCSQNNLNPSDYGLPGAP